MHKTWKYETQGFGPDSEELLTQGIKFLGPLCTVSFRSRCEVMGRYREVGINEAVSRYPVWGSSRHFLPFRLRGWQKGRQRRNSNFVQFNSCCGLETSVTEFSSVISVLRIASYVFGVS